MSKGIIALVGCLLFVSCSQQHAMQPQLDNIRVMIKQSALMAAGVVCAGEVSRGALIHAAAVMDRRAMGGPEMAKIHKMMSMQSDVNGGMSIKMPMKMDKNADMSAEMRQHVALHDAGEAVFSFLDVVSSGDMSCSQAAPIRLAAASAVLREAKGREPEETARKLDANATMMLADKKIPDAVRTLARALQKI